MMWRSSNAGRLVFGATAVAFGILTLTWHNYDGWHLPQVSGGLVIVYAVAVAQIFGGVAIQFRRVAKPGAVALGAVYLVFTLLWVPQIVATPLIFDPWGNLFEQFSLVLGAAFVYASMSPAWKAQTVNRIGRILWGITAVTFALYQAVHINYTAGLVPKWIPPSQVFWVLATTIAFALAAVALLTNRAALLATRLMTLMIAMFGLLVWVPRLISDPHNHGNWSEIILNFGIAAAAWIFADLLDTYRLAL